MQNFIDIQDVHLSYNTASGNLPVLDIYPHPFGSGTAKTGQRFSMAGRSKGYYTTRLCRHGISEPGTAGVAQHHKKYHAAA